MKQVNFTRLIIVALVSIVGYYGLLELLVYFESQDPNSGIHNLYNAVWWSVVTLTSVGYGDLVPTTEGGRIIGFVFLFGSLTIFAILIGQIASIMSHINESRKLGHFGTNFKNHAIIVGWNSFGRTVTDQLLQANKQVAVITLDKNNIEHIRDAYPASQVFALYADYYAMEHLQKANIKEASIVFVNLDDDTEKLVYFLNLKKAYNNLNCIVSLDNADLKQTFLAAGVTYALSKNEIASKLLASYMFEPDVAKFNEEIIAVAETDDLYDIKEYRVTKSNPYVGMYYEKVFYDLKRACNAVLVGIVKCNNQERVLLKNPEGNVTVDEGDYLLLLVNGYSEKKLNKLFRVKEGLI